MFLNLKKQHFYEFISKIWLYCSQISQFPKKIQENFAETQAIPNHKKLNNFPKKLKLPKDYPYLVLQNPWKKPALKAEGIDASLQSVGPHLEALDKYVHIVHSDFRHTRIA